jgi:hypothetical protein
MDVRWWDLVESFLFTGIDHYNYFEEDRNKIKKLCHLLGAEEIYLTADNGRGVGIPENRNYTWEEAEIVLRTEAGDLFIDISKVAANKIIYLPLDNDREYPKLLFDDFTELSPQERFILHDKIFFKDFNSGYNNPISSLTSCVFSDTNPNLEKAMQLKNELEEAMKNVVANSSKLAYVNTIYAFVHFWNNELEIVNDLQTTFLKESLIYKNGSAPKYKTPFNNFNIVEDYLYLIFSSCNYSFIEKLIKEYPFIPSYFYLCYSNYLKYIKYENASISERQQLSYKESKIDVYYKKYWQPIHGLSINEKLLQAMINKQYSKERIYKYINAGGNVKYFSKKGYNALTKVIENYWSRYLPLYPGNIEIIEQYEHVRFLVELGVDVNFIDKEGYTSLYYAFKTLNYKVFELLLQYGVDVNFLHQNTHTILFHINQEISLIKKGTRPSSAYPYLNEMKSLSLKYGGEEVSIS